MKSHSFKTLLAGILLLASFGSASAQTIIRIVGSNGDRTATQTAIGHILDTGWKFQGTSGNWTSTNLSKVAGDNFGAWNGSYSGSPVVIKVSFSGALAGIAAVAGGQPTFRFVVTDGSGTGTVPNPLTGTTLGTDYELGAADFGFSTNFQSTSPYQGLFQGVTYSTVTEEIVGVSPLVFYGSAGFPGSPSNPRAGYTPNITTQLAQLLYTSGAVPLSQFTGDYTVGTDDVNKIVYAIGRNTDAGQRYGAYTEIGLGTTTQVRDWFPTITGQTTTNSIKWGGTTTAIQLWPVATQPGGFAVPLGSGGYSSGALLTEPLTTTLTSNAYKAQYLDENNQSQFLYANATGGYFIGYATPGDGSPRILGSTGNVPSSNQGVALAYNGVPYNAANVQNGTYTAWVYNRILKPQSGLAGTQLTFANALRDQIKNVDATAAAGSLFDDANFKVKRSTDGGLVVPK